MRLLQQAVDDNILDIIVRFNTTKEAWYHIQTKYHGSTRMISVRRQTLRKKFELLQMKEEETIQQYIAKVFVIVNQIKGLGFELADEDVVSKVMRSLSSIFVNVVTSIEEARDISTLTLNELSGSLQAHEARFNQLSDKHKDKAFVVRGESSGGIIFVRG